MLNGWASVPLARRLHGVGLRRRRMVALVAGTLAALIMLVVGCTSITAGTGVGDPRDAPAYRTSVSISISESAATSSIRESKRQQSLTTQAVRSSCETFASTSVDAVKAVNAYIGAYNASAGGAGAAAAEGPAVDALKSSADLVSKSLSSALSADLIDALKTYAASARGLAAAITGHYGPDGINTAVDKFNNAKTNAIGMCRAAF